MSKNLTPAQAIFAICLIIMVVLASVTIVVIMIDSEQPASVVEPVIGPIMERSTDPPKLPTGATNIKDAGNGWITFECNLAGKNRTFLYSRHKIHWDTRGPAVVITELRD